MSTVPTDPERPPRVVLFIVTSFWAFGELAIAVEFARRLAGTGFRPWFLIPPTHRGKLAGTGLRHDILIPGAGKLNRMVLRDIQDTHRPAMVVLADFLNFDFCERHYGLLREDLDVFDCPIGTFDDFTWGRPGSWLDTYGFRAKYSDDISLNRIEFRLRPCPLNNPLTPGEHDVWTYPMLDPKESWLDGGGGPGRATRRREVRAELGVPAGRPLILLTSATWQQMHAAYPRVNAFVDACTAMTERLMRLLLPEASVIAVGPPVLFLDETPAGFHPVGQIDPESFRRYATAVDLHLSNNIVSVSLHRLALAGIPSVALFSSLSKVDGQTEWLDSSSRDLSGLAAEVVEKVDYLYPFRMFPVGWYHFLNSLLAANPFTEMVAHAEVFREEEALETIVALLSDGPQRRRTEAARQRYQAALDALPEPGAILAQISGARVGS